MCFTLTRLRMMTGEPKRCSIWSKWRPATCAYGSAWSTGREVEQLLNICDKKWQQADQTEQESLPILKIKHPDQENCVIFCVVNSFVPTPVTNEDPELIKRIKAYCWQFYLFITNALEIFLKSFLLKSFWKTGQLFSDNILQEKRQYWYSDEKNQTQCNVKKDLCNNESQHSSTGKTMGDTNVFAFSPWYQTVPLQFWPTSI